MSRILDILQPLMAFADTSHYPTVTGEQRFAITSISIAIGSVIEACGAIVPDICVQVDERHKVVTIKWQFDESCLTIIVREDRRFSAYEIEARSPFGQCGYLHGQDVKQLVWQTMAADSADRHSAAIGALAQLLVWAEGNISAGGPWPDSVIEARALLEAELP